METGAHSLEEKGNKDGKGRQAFYLLSPHTPHPTPQERKGDLIFQQEANTNSSQQRLRFPPPSPSSSSSSLPVHPFCGRPVIVFSHSTKYESPCFGWKGGNRRCYFRARKKMGKKTSQPPTHDTPPWLEDGGFGSDPPTPARKRLKADDRTLPLGRTTKKKKN
eukprot:Sspe_Gene.19510::Locus_7117_Transcript_1_1_Confidence_1.000_Length_580::g.19510::m.19510